MWKVEAQYHDAEGVHRWQSASPQRFGTREEAVAHSRECCDVFLKMAWRLDLWSARYRVVVASVAACLVLQ